MDLSPHLALLSEPLRVRILAVLTREELGVGELCRIVQVPQSTMSRHLKDLRVAGWVRRRAEGTAGLVRLDTSDLADESVQLWDVVRRAFETTPQAAEDAARLHAVLDARNASTSFFGRVQREWEQVRRDLFGDDYLIAVLTALLPDGMRIADLGCGTGEMLVHLAPACEKVIGVDREPAMLDVAAEKTAELPNVELRRGGLDELPLKRGEVDVALCMLVLHHVEPLDRAFAELRRIIDREGRVVILDMQAHERSEYRQTMGHVHLGFAETTIRDLAADAGLRVVSYRAIGPARDANGPPLFVATLAR